MRFFLLRVFSIWICRAVTEKGMQSTLYWAAYCICDKYLYMHAWLPNIVVPLVQADYSDLEYTSLEMAVFHVLVRTLNQMATYDAEDQCIILVCCSFTPYTSYSSFMFTSISPKHPPLTYCKWQTGDDAFYIQTHLNDIFIQIDRLYCWFNKWIYLQWNI